MKIKVIYLAKICEDIGKSEEIIELLGSESKIKDIYLKLGLGNLNYKIYAAKNLEHANFESSINDNDEIAFFPTITGG